MRLLIEKNIFLIVILAAVIVGGLYLWSMQKSPPSPAKPDSARQGKIDASQILSGGPGKDGIPSIDNPKFWNVNEAEKFLKDEDVVLGLEYEGEARAYPLRILTWYEIVNDTVAGRPVLVTYCPLCYTGIAFKREINGVPSQFGVSGKLYNNNLLMYNRPNDEIREENLWSQQLGEAVVGSLTGTKLEQIIVDTLIWKNWKEKHPNTKVLSTDTGFSRNYNANPYDSYEFDQQILFPLTNADDRLPRKTKVYGVKINGKLKAYPVEKLERGQTVADTVGGETIVITVDKNGSVRIVNKKTSEEVPWQISFWFSWAAFHPDTEVYE